VTRLVRREFSFIWRLLRRLGLPAADADDATQQVFLVASRRIDAIKAGSERAFLFGTALRVASRMRKQNAQQVHVDISLVELHQDPGPHPDELAERGRARALLDEILASWAEDLRVTFVLYEVEELTMAEIAALLELPMGTVASRLRRARELFTRAVGQLQNQSKEARDG
jgi:RNA polymerase sigma-70 factor (ECF subfamily)